MEKNDIIRKIDYHRTLRGVSVRELSRLTGINYAYLTTVFSGKQNISIERLALIVDSLELEVLVIPKKDILQSQS